MLTTTSLILIVLYNWYLHNNILLRTIRLCILSLVTFSFYILYNIVNPYYDGSDGYDQLKTQSEYEQPAASKGI